ncbi:DUF397 domain-containing protein [Streptomyces sp. NBC_00847]|uniref:DUF397 domain-containing protein n=1 Tax=unclassified Streptomyces TaxID=2593676 RepID=UPI002252D1DD|nr:DUF397 domain-containing protein [Streptomyces sp. NBC_00847]MCX4880966.1 DUF397 domain-containing protein [Streptomyces sp. NBC_00847]
MVDGPILNAAALNGWRTSTYSGNEGGGCIEVLDDYPPGVPVRDSKVPQGPALVFPSAGWTSFIATIKNGSFPA